MVDDGIGTSTIIRKLFFTMRSSGHSISIWDRTRLLCRQLNESNSQFVNLDTTPFEFSSGSSNRFTGVSCSKLASISTNNSFISGCFSMCNENATNLGVNSSCQSGINCCQTTISSPLKNFNVSVEAPQSSIISNGGRQQDCNYAFLVDQNWFGNNLNNLQDLQRMTHVPVRLNWGIDSSSFNRSAALNNSTSFKSTSSCTSGSSIVQCKCFEHYQGNPYLLRGCQDIDECNLGYCPPFMICENYIGGYSCYPKKESKVFVIVFGTGGGLVGLILLIVGIWWLLNIIKRKREIKLKEKYFEHNGGLLLQQQLTSSDGSVDRSKLFNSKDLEKATDHFNVNRILGEGGQGTVYKGMLTDGRIVAVKKSKIVDEVGKVDEFINENQLYDILDAQVLKLGKKEEVMAVANLAKRCLNMNAKKRPTMKEVTMELEGIRSSIKEGHIQLNYQEDEYERTEVLEAWDVDSTSTGTTFDHISLSIDVQPLLTKRISRKNIQL
ncbi:hypothetical protein Pint_07544 [Pistacia integerrima]|uniref:Uncharacterized protein n=1 Tax=Pistacia integerrima TaxID=434235 RepID=A0ACC0Y0E1_9ROSI|nr:hypothetical protein Pint_07544 [Pistacia integerrima]